MKTFRRFRRYLANLFLKWEMFEINVVERIKTHILCSITFFRKSCRLWDNVEKLGGARGATNDVTIWRIRVICWISKGTRTYAHAHAHAPGYPHSRTRAYASTHRPVINTCRFSTATMIRKRASMLRHTYTVCLVNSVTKILIMSGAT